MEVVQEESVPPVEEGFKCMSCKKLFSVDQLMEIMFLEKCSHVTCRACLKEAIDLFYPDVKCPYDNCEDLVLDYEVKEVLGDKEYEEL